MASAAAVQFGQAFGDGQAEAQALLFVHLSIELHVRANPGDVLGGKTAALIGDGQGQAAGLRPPATR